MTPKTELQTKPASFRDSFKSEFIRSHDLIGFKVFNQDGEEIGKIEELVFEMDSGKISYCVLSFGGFLGLGDKLFAVPWNLLNIDLKNKKGTMFVHMDRLKNAPGFDKSHWPKMSESYWTTELDKHYR